MTEEKRTPIFATAVLFALASLSPILADAQAVTGTGTANQVTKWTSASKLGNSAITETSGNVGIGTTSPQRQLHIGNGIIRIDRSTDGTQFILNRTGLKAFMFGVNASDTNTGEFFLSDLGNATTGNGSRRFTITNTGNMGIGTSTPANKLSVTGAIQSTTGGFVFPDGSIQTTAAGGAGNVQHNATLTGNGSGSSKLGITVPLVLSASANGVIQGSDTGGGYGVYGKSVSGFGVYGESSVAVAGNSSSNIGVYGTGPYAGVSSYGGTYGVLSTAYNTSGTADGIHTTGANGVYAVSNRPGGNGIYAVAQNNSTSDYAIWGVSNTGYAGVFNGNVSVSGTLTKSAGTFKIDDPLDPENKYLSHSFVESPDMMNIYNGNAELDRNGEAVVLLPDYFTALNKEYRYQLTAVGAPGPNLYVAQEISGNRFSIAGGEAGGKVSWQITGIRQDAYANAHRTPVEEVKPVKERGTYLHPELFGQPEEKGKEWALHPDLMRRAKQSGSKPLGEQQP